MARRPSGQADEFPTQEWAELQASKNRNGKIEGDSIWTEERQRQTYGNGERYFFHVSYGILMDERNSYAT